MSTAAENSRSELIKKLFPEGIPKLWSPPLAHYTGTKSFDPKHTRAHLAHMAPYTKTHLIPGSTGDGWEMCPAEIDGLLEFIIKETRDLGIRLLIGVLRPSAETVRKDIEATVQFLTKITGAGDPAAALEASGVCGFTVCAPKGRDLPQDIMKAKLKSILDLGYPTALYQLPLVTENEIAPEVFEALAAEYGNFYMFKDSSGRDTVSLSGVKTGGVFMVRGAEGDYSQWYAGPLYPRTAGKYDGFLLGSANCFARWHYKIIENINAGKQDEAAYISDKISIVITEAMSRAAKIPFGNAFANSNKAFDHFFAYGPGACDLPAPMTHSGKRLPDEYMQFAHDILEDTGFLPEKGYLE
jgi:dihydrodipicolinate synthase/N-acetylneuraminate lyase